MYVFKFYPCDNISNAESFKVFVHIKRLENKFFGRDIKLLIAKTHFLVKDTLMVLLKKMKYSLQKVLKVQDLLTCQETFVKELNKLIKRVLEGTSLHCYCY